MQPKARMTFRFDPPKPQTRPPEARPQPVMGPPNAISEPPAATDRKESSQQGGTATEQAAYYMGGPLQDDLYTLEEMIRRSEPVKLRTHAPVLPLREVPAEPGDTEAEWNTGWSPPGDLAEEAAGQSPAWLPGALIRRDGPSWWRVFGSVAGAVATGALFGYLVLTLFTGDSPLPTPSDAARTGTPAQAPANSAAAGVSRPQAGGTHAADPGDSAAAQTTAVSESSFYLLQFGVFRTEASMNAAVKELTNKGLPHAADRSDGFRVYAGAAATKEEAERLAARLSGIEVYLKPVVGGAVDAAGAEWAAFIDNSTDLTRQLSRLSVDTLQQDAAQPIDTETLKTLRQSHRLWLQSLPGDAMLNGPERQSAKTMESALSAAMVSVDDYTRQMSRLHLWDIQSHVTQAVLADRSLRAAMQDRLEK